MPPNARVKTTIGTATATARVVVETPPPDLLSSEADEVLEAATPVEVPEAWLLPPFSACPSNVPVSADSQLVSISNRLTAEQVTSLIRRPNSCVAQRTL
jgi:hypothetical protein